MRLVLLVILFALITALETLAAYPKHLVGVDYSTISGSGLSYSLELDRSNALKLSGIAMYYGEKPPDKMNVYANLGAEYQYNVWKIKNNRVFLFSGLSYWYIEKRDVRSYMKNEKLIIEKNTDFNHIINFGAGVGYELVIMNNISITMNLGYQYQKSDGVGFPILFDRSPNSDKYLGIGGGLGLKFILK